MLNKSKMFICVLFLLIIDNPIISLKYSFAQQYPPPVDIPIQNIPQQTQVWCWAAVARQIIMYSKGPANTPQQCALVAIANGAHPNICCSGYNPQCMVTGSLQQIQLLIGHFGGHFSSIAPPANWQALYQTLQTGRPVILAVSTGFSGHVVVVRGMSFHPSVGPVLHINDPLQFFTQPVPFLNIIPYWVAAIVVY